VFVRRRKQSEYEEARRLRLEHGTPLKRIAARVGVSVSTVHVWTKDIELTAEQHRRNASGPRGPQSPQQIQRRTQAISRGARARRAAYQAEGRRRASEGDPLHRAGCMLYWAEGSKDRNTLGFVNSDRPMVQYFVRFLRESLGVTPEEITVRLNVDLTNGLSLREVEDHWLWALELPRASLRKHMINHAPTSSSGARRHKLPYGVCAVRVKRSTRLVQHIYGAIQEYAGFEEPRWLDGPPRKPRASAPAELGSPSGAEAASRRQRGAR
jgi:AcrR family transcriptional regulator